MLKNIILAGIIALLLYNLGLVFYAYTSISTNAQTTEAIVGGLKSLL